MEFTQLSPEQLAALESNVRQTGRYKNILEQFVASDVTAADLSNAFGETKLASAAGALKRQVAQHDEFANVRVLHVKDGDTEYLAIAKQ